MPSCSRESIDHLLLYFVVANDLYGLFGWRGEGGGVEGSRVELAKNKLILC